MTSLSALGWGGLKDLEGVHSWSAGSVCTAGYKSGRVEQTLQVEPVEERVSSQDRLRALDMTLVCLSSWTVVGITGGNQLEGRDWNVVQWSPF